MAELGDEVRDILAADGTLTALLTGGILLYEEIGSIGISRKTHTSLYNGLILKPHALVRARNRNPVQGVRHEPTHQRSFQQIVEVQFFNDKDAGYSVVEQARHRTYALLAGTRTPSGLLLEWLLDEIRKRDYAFDLSPYERTEYRAHGLVGASGGIL